MIPERKWLEDPTVFRVNRLDAHSDHITYRCEEEYRAEATSLRQSLDGVWTFGWFENMDAAPAFWEEAFDLSAFGTIAVPGHGETQGFGQIQYINKLYPWDGHEEIRPPQIPKTYNPTLCYVKDFDLDPGLLGKEVCVSFQGIEKAAYVWCNGHFVGYCEDTFTPSDFDLTPYLKEKGNRLCLRVHKHASSAWIEDQDFFRFSGIFRPVYLYAKPMVEDLWIQTALSDDLKEGSVRFRLKGKAGMTVHGKIAYKGDTLFAGDLELTETDGYLFSQTLNLGEVKLWDYDLPELYDISLTVFCDGVTEFVPSRTGFRRIEMGSDKVMYLNGKRLMINGVNRHEWSHDKGRAINIEDMEKAMATIRENNINAVRTCHYPNRTEWYHLCDEAGIYLMDETNLESHGSWQKDALGDASIDPSWNVPGSFPQWHDCLLDRAKSMFERDKNHVSILFWSCGNEAFCGSNIVDQANWFRSVDPSRLVHYEGVYFTRGVANGKPTSAYWRPEYETVSDMESRMYATPWDVRDYLQSKPDKPYISCEYMHNMGNSLGGMESYVNLGEEFPQYQGGFIWDFMDQAISYVNCNGRQVLGYGGDFGERQADYNFSGNGIVDAYGNPKPCMQEVRYWHSDREARQLHDRKNQEILEKMEDNLRSDEKVLEFLRSRCSTLTVTHGDGAIGVRGDGFEILFSFSQAGPASLRYGSTEWLFRGPRPAYWRAPTENDIGCGFPLKSAIWSAVEQYQHCSGWEILEETADAFAITYRFTAAAMPDLRTDVTYRVDKLGCLDVTVHYFGGQGRPELPLLGLRFATPKPVSQTVWGGLSGETYPDRYKGAVAGRHEEVPGIPNYLVPQECGNHMHTLWVSLRMDGGKLGLYRGDKPFHFSALPYTPGQLEQAYHVEELPASNRTVVTVCGEMRGVGGIDTWGSDVEKPFRVGSDKDIVFTFRIRG